MRGAWWLLLAACSSRRVERPIANAAPKDAAQSIDDSVVSIEHVETCPGARATWRGERENGNETFTTLTLVGDAAKPIKIDLENVPRANWSFAIFSPDCTRVLLLLSRTGPYHVVRVDHLARYAAGERPEMELDGKPDPKTETGTGNLRDGVWLSNTEIAYAWGCCDPPVQERVVIPHP